MALVLLGESAEEGEEAEMESLSDSGGAGSTGGRGSLRVPSKWPALMNCMGMLRSFLPDSYAVVRWLEDQRASSFSENLDAVAVEVNGRQPRRAHCAEAQTYTRVPATIGTGGGWRASCAGCSLPSPCSCSFPFFRAT